MQHSQYYTMVMCATLAGSICRGIGHWELDLTCVVICMSLAAHASLYGINRLCFKHICIFCTCVCVK